METYQSFEAYPFIRRQERLQRAIERCEKKLSEFKTSEIQISSEVWNGYHDLKDRLESRLKENYIEYQHKHFEHFGYCFL